MELNNTFYNMPTAERLLSFYERSEGKLNFSVKANRLLTHEIGADWKLAAKDFKEALKPLHSTKSLAGLGTGIIKLAGLSYHDRSGANDQYFVDIGSFRHR